MKTWSWGEILGRDELGQLGLAVGSDYNVYGYEAKWINYNIIWKSN